MIAVKTRSSELPDHLAGISDAGWQTAAERLKTIGAFADESRDFLPEQVAKTILREIEAKVRAAGYAGGHLALAPVSQSNEGVSLLLYDQDRFTDVSSAEAAWRADYNTRWQERVKQRVADWQRRLGDLRNELEAWIKESNIEGLSLVERRPVVMNEELMRRFRVPPVQVPTYEISRQGNRLMRIQPKGLWVIGANGRVDITTKNASLMFVDESEPMSKAADWKIYEGSDRRRAVSLQRETFLNLLRQIAA